MKHETRTMPSTPNQLRLALSKDPKTKDDLITIKAGDYTEIALSMDESRALIESLTRLHTLHLEHHAHQVERARINAKVLKKTRGVASGC